MKQDYYNDVDMSNNFGNIMVLTIYIKKDNTPSR